MEEINSCSICYQKYDRIDCIPKVLECGHTFCSPCLFKVFRSETTSCPSCKAAIKGDKSFLLINYTTLKVVEVYKSKSLSENEVVTSSDFTRMKRKCMDRRDILLRKKLQIESSLEVLENHLEKFEKLSGPESTSVDTVHGSKILNEVKEELKKTDDVVRWKEIKDLVTIRLSNFEDTPKYLIEIYNRVQNKESVFSVCQIKDQITYGEISLYENKLFFHSLSLSEVPKESSLIWFDEIKQCVNYKNFSPFMKICCNEKKISRILIFKMLPYEKSHHFIKLCTGEYGPSYKGASFVKGVDDEDSQNILIAQNFIENGQRCNRAIDYNFTEIRCDKCAFACEVDQMYLYMPSDKERFEIFNCKIIGDYYNIVGRVISPTNLKDCIDYNHSSYLKIIDCGIILEVF